MEGDAGTSQLNPTDEQDVTSQDVVTTEPSAEESIEEPGVTGESEGAQRPARIGRGIALTVCVVLVALAAAVGAGGWFALKSHRESQTLAANETAAIAAAKDCVTATQAPDTSAMIAAQTKIIECATGAYATQASFMSGITLEAYKAANVQVQISQMRAAVEKHNDDGSMDVLVAVRVKISNSAEKDKEVGYRMRAQMAPVDGKYKVAKLDQVTS
ncbi:hypothetical protein [Mycolicibacterium llatzerense]|jgi:Mce-associated membrane protein|uniref:Membrane protein n=1 Tax=Mycolicibacterium llatzerense TaxID=280871 RepID=A0A0D1L7L6_9MYCO|nr:hypothetical protein [Mycolicibacterium llatzerense]KIU16940.1 membrane protein [Mycolicibacterium llatzerense]